MIYTILGATPNFDTNREAMELPAEFCEKTDFKDVIIPQMIATKSRKILHNGMVYKGDFISILVKTDFKYKGKNEFVFVFPYVGNLRAVLKEYEVEKYLFSKKRKKCRNYK